MSAETVRNAYSAVRCRELTDMGTWPWRWVVEGRRVACWRKRWPWSKEATVLVPAEWERLRHGLRDHQPMQADDASSLARHYRKRFGLDPDQ